MILKINYYFQLTVITIFAISNILMFNGIWLASSMFVIGVLHLVSFVLLMFHPLSRTGSLFSNWMNYFAGIILVFLMIITASNIGGGGLKLVIVPVCLLLAFYFVYNSYQLWKTREYDNA